MNSIMWSDVQVNNELSKILQDDNYKFEDKYELHCAICKNSLLAQFSEALFTFTSFEGIAILRL